MLKKIIDSMKQVPLICDSLCPVHEAGSSLQSPCMVREELPAQHCPGHPALAECPAMVTVALKQPWRAGIPALSSPTANWALLGAEPSPPTPQPKPCTVGSYTITRCALPMAGGSHSTSETTTTTSCMVHSPRKEPKI